MSECFGIRQDGDSWRCFTDDGDHPGHFADSEAARWGTWATSEDVERINGSEGRLITMEDLQAAIRRHPEIAALHQGPTNGL